MTPTSAATGPGRLDLVLLDLHDRVLLLDGSQQRHGNRSIGDFYQPSG